MLTYAVWRYADISGVSRALPAWSERLLMIVGAAAVLVGASLLLYQPFTHWYPARTTTPTSLWKGGRSDISSYLIHWGVFLFFIVSWLIWETRQWLAETPVSALRKLRPYQGIDPGGIACAGAFPGAPAGLGDEHPGRTCPGRHHHPLAGLAAGGLGGRPVLPPRPAGSPSAWCSSWSVPALLLTMMVEMLVVMGATSGA